MKTIYFAGAVSKNDWRNHLAREADGRIMSMGGRIYTAPDGGQFRYGGPFAISCDHGCFHIGAHGAQGSPGCSGTFNTERGYYVDTDGLSAAEIFGRCTAQIKACDAVLCYIAKPDCYGTLLELGYAYARSKPIYLFIAMSVYQSLDAHTSEEHAITREVNELWFIKESATVCRVVPDEEIWIPAELLEYPKDRYHEYLKSSEWNELRKAKIKEAGGRCQLCNAAKKINVHHRTYERIGHELPTDLIAMCEDCHAKFHGIAA